MKFIAEIGYNHLGKLNIAKELVDELSEIKEVKFIKFQIDNPEYIYLKNTKEFNIFKNFSLNLEEYKNLFFYIQQKGKIPLFSTSNFDIFNISPFNSIKYLKIASGSVFNFKIYEAIKKLKPKLFISLGAIDIKELNILEKYLKENNFEYQFLYCVSKYPATINDINLSFFNYLKQKYNNLGYSDHTKSLALYLFLFERGVKLFETHIMLDRLKEKSIEKEVSLTVSEFKNLIYQLKEMQNLLEKENSDRLEDLKVNKEFRRGIYAYKNIKQEAISIDNVIFLRPINGLLDIEFLKINGKTPKKEYKKFEALKDIF